MIINLFFQLDVFTSVPPDLNVLRKACNLSRLLKIPPRADLGLRWFFLSILLKKPIRMCFDWSQIISVTGRRAPAPTSARGWNNPMV
jgi:hypothetical protein